MKYSFRIDDHNELNEWLKKKAEMPKSGFSSSKRGFTRVIIEALAAQMRAEREDAIKAARASVGQEGSRPTTRAEDVGQRSPSNKTARSRQSVGQPATAKKPARKGKVST